MESVLLASRIMSFGFGAYLVALGIASFRGEDNRYRRYMHIAFGLFGLGIMLSRVEHFTRANEFLTNVIRIAAICIMFTGLVQLLRVTRKFPHESDRRAQLFKWPG